MTDVKEKKERKNFGPLATLGVFLAGMAAGTFINPVCPNKEHPITVRQGIDPIIEKRTKKESLEGSVFSGNAVRGKDGGVYVLTCIGSSERDIKNLYLRYTTPWGEVAMEPLFSGKVFGGYIREEEDGRGLVARYGIEENGKKMYREVEISYGSGVANSEKAYSIEQKEYEDEMPSNVRNYFSGK
jgi:hypothetical protein